MFKPNERDVLKPFEKDIVLCSLRSLRANTKLDLEFFHNHTEDFIASVIEDMDRKLPVTKRTIYYMRKLIIHRISK